jgi:hypothetical protein
LQPGPREDLNHCNWVLGSSGKRSRDVPSKFRRRRSPAARGNWPGRFRELARTLLGVMCKSELTGGGGTAVNRGGGDGEGHRRASGRRNWSSKVVERRE